MLLSTMKRPAGLFGSALLGATLPLSLFLFLGSAAFAQTEVPLDPSSVLLLNQGGAGTAVNAIESGRYSPRPKTEIRSEVKTETKPATRKPKEAAPEETPEPVTVVVPTPAVPVNPPVARPTAAEVQPQPIIIRCGEPESSSKKCSNGATDFGRRANILELSFAPGFLYNDSQSTYAYRSYSSAAPLMAFSVDFWPSPTFALHAEYESTLGAQVSDAFNGSRNVAANHEWMSAGFRSRRFSTSDNSGSSLVFGVDYQDYQFHVPLDSQIREGLHTSGLKVAIEGEIFNHASSSWTLGVFIAPKLRLTESATSINFRSGGSVEVNAVGFSVGRRYQLDRNDAIFWKLSHSIEKEVFTGDASLTDPRTGLAPSGVGVVNSFSVFEIGYSWGN